MKKSSWSPTTVLIQYTVVPLLRGRYEVAISQTNHKHFPPTPVVICCVIPVSLPSRQVVGKVKASLG